MLGTILDARRNRRISVLMELYILLGPGAGLGVVPLSSQRDLLFKKKYIYIYVK